MLFHEVYQNPGCLLVYDVIEPLQKVRALYKSLTLTEQEKT